MTIAEIRGKMKPYESMEDLLTSDVFGVLRYLPPKEGLIPILEDAINLQGERFTLTIEEEPQTPIFDFWPNLNESIPDVMIKLNRHIIIIEVKYKSGKSGHFNMEEETSVDIIESAKPDQLRREFLDLLDFKNQLVSLSLIYVTAHRVIPEDDIISGREALIATNGLDFKGLYESKVFWLSWYKIREKIKFLMTITKDVYKKKILQDVEKLFFYKGFRRFNGYPFNGFVTPFAAKSYRRRNRKYFNQSMSDVFKNEFSIFYGRKKNGRHK